MDESQKHDAMRKKPDTKHHVVYDFICMTFPEKADLQRQKADQWVPGVGDRIGD